jgi:serine/threonine-protein kinase
MFLDEARLSARLSHPNVVQTNEVNVENGRAFLAMEYLDGQSLGRVRSRLGREGKLSLGAHVRVLIEACSGLHYAHELRDLDGVPLDVVHRDVSPHNVFVTYDGQVKLVDFGVAKAMSQSHETNVGVVKGKIPYMPPEQARSERIDRRADIFALGVLLWEAVAGKRMWSGHRAEGVLRRLMTNDVPSLGDVVPDVDVRLANIVARATAPFPEARYPTAELLRRDLESWLSTRPDGGHPSLRELGDEMTRGFAAERAEVARAVNEQLQLVREAAGSGRSGSIGLVRLNDAGTSGSHPSGSHDQPAPSVSDAHPILPRVSVLASNGDASASRPGSQGSVSIVMATSPSVAQRAPRARSAMVFGTAAAAMLLAAGAGAVMSFGRGRDSGLADAGSDAGAKASCAVDPKTTEQYLNACGDSECIPFDRTRLDGLMLPDGALPPVPSTTTP